MVEGAGGVVGTGVGGGGVAVGSGGSSRWRVVCWWSVSEAYWRLGMKGMWVVQDRYMRRGCRCGGGEPVCRWVWGELAVAVRVVAVGPKAASNMPFRE